MAEIDADAATGQPKRRTFKKFSFRGVDLDALLDMSIYDLVNHLPLAPGEGFSGGFSVNPWH
ncbi:40S ribosomal protein S15-5 [Acorus calamus]|uniref:40S ribosomal protein S15-5 n=1 Tax=Acorus calamus TaxID=4465 RepID=A0AAV9EKI0_ACOCL|nr:40S ribosomal protein S15-5 [Acorus calamus]